MVGDDTVLARLCPGDLVVLDEIVGDVGFGAIPYARRASAVKSRTSPTRRAGVSAPSRTRVSRRGRRPPDETLCLAAAFSTGGVLSPTRVSDEASAGAASPDVGFRYRMQLGAPGWLVFATGGSRTRDAARVCAQAAAGGAGGGRGLPSSSRLAAAGGFARCSYGMNGTTSPNPREVASVCVVEAVRHLGGVDPSYGRQVGRVNPNVLPAPGLLVTRTSPPSFSTIRFTIDRPSPCPSSSVGVTRENSSNSRPTCSSFRP